MQLTARTLNRLEVWTAPQSAGGTRLGFARDVVECVAEVSLTAPDRLRVELPIDSAAAPLLVEQRALRVWESDARFDEWRLATKVLSPDVGRIRLEGEPIESYLGIRAAPVSELTAGVRYYHRDIIGQKPSEIIDGIVLPALTADGVAWLARGTISQDTPIDLALAWHSPLQLLQAIADALKLELEFRRNGTASYFVDLLTAIGASAPAVDLRYTKNLRTHELERQTRDQVSRVFPRGMSDGEHEATMARAAWRVVSVVGSVVTLADPIGGDGPIAFDDQLNGKYLRKKSGTLTQITDSAAAADTVTVADATGIVAEDLVQVRANVGGDDLTSLDSPADVTAYGVVVGIADAADIPGTNNVIPNPAVRTWPAGVLPTGWTAIGAPTTSKELGAPFFRTAPFSLKVIAAVGEGVKTPAGNVFPTAATPFGSGFASFWLASGKVKVELELTTGGGPVIVPLAAPGATSGVTGQWVDLGVSGDDWNALGATAVAVRIVAIDGAATFYVDRAQGTEGAAQLPFVEGSGGTRLWQLANEALLKRGAPLPTFSIAMADLARALPADWPFDAIPEKGASVVVTDSRILAASAGSRIAALRINYSRPGETQVTVSNRPDDLTGTLSRTGRAARLTPGTGELPVMVPQVVLDIKNDGASVLALTGSAAIRSWRYATNGAAYPSDATALGGTIVDGRAPADTALAFLEYGERLFVTVIPFTGPNGTGVAGPSIRVNSIRTGGTDIPQATISIGVDGAVTIKVDGPGWAGSYKYATSTSAQPSDGDALAGTTVNGRQVTVTPVLFTVPIGGSVFATFIPFRGSGATGFQGASIKIQATRHDFSANKTVWMSAASLLPFNPFSASRYAITNGYVGIQNYNMGTDGGANVIFAQVLVIPDGVTLTNFSSNVYSESGKICFVTGRIDRIDDTGGFTIILTDSSINTGWETLSAGGSEATAGRKYRFIVALQPNSFVTPPLNNELRIANYSYTYSMPSSDKAV